MANNIQQYVYRYTNGGENPVTSKDPNTHEDINIYDNFIKGTTIIKLGIKAPPGTSFIVNGHSVFTVGPSGVFSINKPGYEITDLKFLRPMAVEKDTDATEELLSAGMKKMDKAISDFLNSEEVSLAITKNEGENMNERVNVEVTSASKNGDIYVITDPSLYYGYYSDFLKNFTSGFQDYSLGVKGVYRQKTTKNENNETVVVELDLQNIIIDVEYKQSEGGNNNE